jgi:prepilin-type N-terminal cleavage/methylation domain-containing protein
MRRRRAGYTLLEVLVSLAIAVMLLAAVYSVIGYQLRQAQAGRDLIEQATLARAILQKIDADVRSTISLGDPARFRRQPESTGQSGMSGSGGGMGTTTSGMSTTGTTTGSGSGTSTTTPTTTTTAGTTTADPASSSMTSTDPATSGQVVTVVSLPLGVVGGASELHLFASKFPNEAFSGDADAPVTCDIRRVSWWLGEGDVGLCRAEERLVTTEEAATASVPGGDPAEYQIAPEVKSFEVLYFDGSSWVDSWDSTELGPDQLTPKGSPRVIKVRVGIARPNNPDELKYHTRVILIPTAGGAPPATVPMTAEEAATTTTSP